MKSNKRQTKDWSNLLKARRKLDNIYEAISSQGLKLNSVTLKQNRKGNWSIKADCYSEGLQGFRKCHSAKGWKKQIRQFRSNCKVWPSYPSQEITWVWNI